MIKKSISSILVLLVVVNSIGCYSKTTLRAETDIEKLQEGDNVIIITKDGNEHNIMVEKVEGTEIHGIEYGETWMDSYRVVIQSEDISTIQHREPDYKKTASTVASTAITVIIVLGVLAGVALIYMIATFEK